MKTISVEIDLEQFSDSELLEEIRDRELSSSPEHISDEDFLADLERRRNNSYDFLDKMAKVITGGDLICMIYNEHHFDPKFWKQFKEEIEPDPDIILPANASLPESMCIEIFMENYQKCTPDQLRRFFESLP